jgi:enoyl-CoA hydratase/carnithine racemase
VVDELLLDRDGAILRVTFNRPRRRNALTWEMYDALLAVCHQVEADPGVRVLVLRGAGGEAFVSGTDIAQFAEFASGEDGVEYERRVSDVLEGLTRLRVPTIAVVTGWCVGAGLAVAAACDLRIATHGSRFAIPIARTVGNTPSLATIALLADQLGVGRTLDLLLRARAMTAREAHEAGFVCEVCGDEEIVERTAEIERRLLEHAPLTMWAAKEAMHRLRTARLPDDTDILRRVYGSEDFREGVRAFLAREPPRWGGR